jgi:hybrid cluster-associated redox disulfide protein
MSQTITKDMRIAEVVQRWPETAEKFLEWGLHCIGCGIARFESIEQGANTHGIPADELVKDLNNTIKEKNQSKKN